MEAIEWMQDVFNPRHQLELKTQTQHCPRVEAIQQHTFDSHPRVRFTEVVEIRDGSEEPIQTMEEPSQLIVASSNEAIVTPKSILKPPNILLSLKMTP